MMDVDRPRLAAQAAGLRRLSTRAASTSASSSASSTPRCGALHSFVVLSESVLSHLRIASVPILPGLSEPELFHLESTLGFSFPPDLRSLLSLGLPSCPGFPDWRCPSSLPPSLQLPLAAASLQVARSSLWPRCWGQRPRNQDRALRLARSALRRAPPLIPLFDNCYIPARPCLAGNPVFHVTEDRVVCCGTDLFDFFAREFPLCSSPSNQAQQMAQRSAGFSGRRSLDAAIGKAPRWIEFWSDAASDSRRRCSSSSEASSSSSHPDSVDPDPEARPAAPRWVEGYLDGIGTVLRAAGWEESEVDEMVRTSNASGLFDGEDRSSVPVDFRSVMDVLVVKADQCSDSLRRAGWSSQDVSYALGLDIRDDEAIQVEKWRQAVKVPAVLALKMAKLAQTVAGSS